MRIAVTELSVRKSINPHLIITLPASLVVLKGLTMMNRSNGRELRLI